jgi:hypothetical protein
MEECKWIKPSNPLGVPVWSHAGIVCTGEAYKQVVKLTFARGASLEDPRGLFNSSLEGNTRRAIDIREGEAFDAEALKALIQAAVAENLRSSAPKSKSPPKAGAKAKPGASEAKPIKVREGEPASRLIDQRIRDLGGWRGETLARMRALILEADPEMTEEWKWMGTPVWSHHGIVCTGEAYTKVVKLTFARGARIPDPSRLFNSSLEGNTRRAIDIHEGEKVDAGAFKALVKAAVAQNGPPAKKR